MCVIWWKDKIDELKIYFLVRAPLIIIIIFLYGYAFKSCILIKLVFTIMKRPNFIMY